MIVNWKKPKAGALVVPLMNKKVVIGKKTLIPGNNQVSEEEWDKMKKSCQRYIDAGLMEVVVVKKLVQPVKEEKKESDGPSESEKADADPNYLPYWEVIEALKGMDMYDQLSEEKKKADGKPNLSKAWLLSKFEEDPVLKDNVFKLIDASKSSEDGNQAPLTEKDVPADIKDLKAADAVDIVVNTFSVETLQGWQKEEGRDEVRAAIANQIEALNKPPTSKNRGIFGKRK